MCNLYSMTKGPSQIRDRIKGVHNLAGNFEPLPAILPNRTAPIIRTAPDGEREMISMRWGFMPAISPGLAASNRCLTNVRNTESRFWRTWLEKPLHRCLVPATSFAVRVHKAKPWVLTWFAQDESRPLMFFAGIWHEWEGNHRNTTAPNFGKYSRFSILTTETSPDVTPIHSDATPVLLQDETARERWMNAPVEEALLLRSAPPAGSLRVVAIHAKQDGESPGNRRKTRSVFKHSALIAQPRP